MTGKGLERGFRRPLRRFAMTHPIQAAPANHFPGYKVIFRAASVSAAFRRNGSRVPKMIAIFP